MWAYMTCEVCKRLDGDMTLKYCGWCGLCQAWICQACIPNLLRRAAAMLSGGA